MFDTSSATADIRTAAALVEAWEQELVGLETEITRQRARQVQLLRKLDRHQVDAGAGMRTMGDWVAAHLDLSAQTANRNEARAQAHAVEEAIGDTWRTDAVVARIEAAATRAGFRHPEVATRFIPPDDVAGVTPDETKLAIDAAVTQVLEQYPELRTTARPLVTQGARSLPPSTTDDGRRWLRRDR